MNREPFYLVLRRKVEAAITLALLAYFALGAMAILRIVGVLVIALASLHAASLAISPALVDLRLGLAVVAGRLGELATTREIAS